MLDVVKIDDEKAEKEIIFENLEYMEFTSMSSLGSFCYGNQTFIFPSLVYFIVKGCRQMEIFSPGVTVAPYLTEIEVGEETTQWKGDINTTIQHLFLEKVHNYFIVNYCKSYSKEIQYGYWWRNIMNTKGGMKNEF
jgi:hypothetical protein